jgi:tetratricopeptide (TPR) repeat protein
MIKLIFTILLLIVISPVWANVETQLATVRRLYAERDFDNAFIFANQLIIENPNSLVSFDARMILADIHIDRGIPAEARMQMMLLMANPFQMTYIQRARAYQILGRAFLAEGNLVEALASFDRLFLDYRDTTEATRSIQLYFDIMYRLNDYQSMIAKSRDMQRHYRDNNIIAELLFHQARGYIAANMLDPARTIISDITTKHPDTPAAGNAIELQVMLLDRDSGKRAAIERLESTLASGRLSRELDERLSWVLVNYLIENQQTTRALERLDYIINRYTMSENLSKYYLVWLRLMTEAKNIRPILNREETIIRVSRNRSEYQKIMFYLAKTRMLAQDYWFARSYLDENINHIQSDSLHFEYQFLYAEIFTAQKQFVNSINIYYQLQNYFSGLGRNYDVLMKLGEINLLHLNQPAQALNFYRQAVSISQTPEQITNALLRASQSLEATEQYTEALNTLTQIPIDRIPEARQREAIRNKITLLQIFYAVDTRTALANYLKRGSNHTLIDQTAILAMDLKLFDEALKLLQGQNTHEARMERVKINFLFSYKHMLEGSNTEADRYTNLFNSERGQLGRNIPSEDQYLLHSMNDFLTNRGKLSNRSVQNANSFVRSNRVNPSGINLKNFFAIQLWNHHSENNDTNQMFEIASFVNADAFVSDFDFQRVNVVLASALYQQRNLPAAITHFQRADKYMTLAYPEYYFQYAMSLHQTGNVQRALDILSSLVLNYVDYENLIEARNMIVRYWVDNNNLSEALDVLNQIPPLRRNDADFRFFAEIYSRIGDIPNEKQSILMIRAKTWEETQRLALLHFYTGDTVIAELTFNEILEKAPLNINKLNAHSGIAHIRFNEGKYAEAIRSYETAMTMYTQFIRDRGAGEFLIPPEKMASELVIASYLSNNKQKADAHTKTYSNLLKSPEIQIELKLYEGVHYQRSEPRRAIRLLTSVIDDRNVPYEIGMRALYHRGIAHINDKKLDLAESDLTMALNTENDKLKNDIRLTLGNFYLSQGDHDSALEAYYQVILNDTDGKQARDAAHNFAIVARQISDYEKAIAAYKIIMDRWGQTNLSEETRLTIGFCFYQARQYNQALNILTQLLEELSTNALKAEALYWIGETHTRNGSFMEAEASFNSIRTRFPREDRWVSIGQLRIAEMYHNRGMTDRAKELFREIVRIYGTGSDIGKEARKYLE